MSYVKPDAVVDQMVHAGAAKARLGVSDLLVRGFLAGALLGFATTLASRPLNRRMWGWWGRWCSR